MNSEFAQVISAFKSYCRCLINWEMMPSAIKVSLVVGSVLLLINHGEGILNRKMTQKRWISAGLTYLVPYCVSIHGQWMNNPKHRH